MTTSPTSVPDTTIVIDCDVTAGHFTVHAKFDAHQGITALFGPSGSGKSITLSAIAGLLRPHAGTIAIHGTVVADPSHNIHVPTQQRNVGMVFQQAALLPHRSPLDNVAMAVRAQSTRLTKQQRRTAAMHWLEQVQAHHLARANTITLSGGEQQRVALARALAGAPQILLLDEPFSALDYATRGALRQLLQELVTEHQLTALVVTHDVDDVTALADRVVTFEPGTTRETFDLAPYPQEVMRKILGLSQ
jgi:molybdate transport system ATP-binding protein